MSRSYVTNLRKGRIENPGYEKMRAIAKAMGFPPEAWFDDALGQGTRVVPKEGVVSQGAWSTSSGRSDTRRRAGPTRLRRSPA